MVTSNKACNHPPISQL